MKAMELSGVHIGKAFSAVWKNVNKDGTPRANAVNQFWYLVPATIFHRQDGSVRITGSWYTRRPIPRKVGGQDRWVGSSVSTHPDGLPYYADLEPLA